MTKFEKSRSFVLFEVCFPIKKWLNVRQKLRTRNVLKVSSCQIVMFDPWDMPGVNILKNTVIYIRGCSLIT